MGFRIFPVVFWMVVLPSIAVCSSVLPREPERDNKEYLLDLVTNEYNRVWREIWDGGDNRLRFRLGSNNVREWFIEEELKFSTRLSRRVRLRFRHSRLLSYSSRRTRLNVLEFEGRAWRRCYFSFLAQPTVEKSDNSLGVVFQRRKRVDRYALVFLELPRFLNNFTEHHKGTADSTLLVYSRQPVKVGFEYRDFVTSRVVGKLSGFMSNSFSFEVEDPFTGSRVHAGDGKVRALDGWIEYICDTTKTLDEQNAFGFELGYAFMEKSSSGAVFPFMGGGDLVVDGSGRRVLGSSWLDFPGIEFGIDPFKPMESDTLIFWSERRKYLSPYLWLNVSSTVGARIGVRLERWSFEWVNTEALRSDVSSRYVVPSLRVRLALGKKKASIVEAGYIAEYRKRNEKHESRSGIIVEESRRYDHRISIAYEYRFRPDAALRIIESIDLDRRDWGQFSVHDHGFFQLIVGF